jgi:carboxylate-amine ligase
VRPLAELAAEAVELAGPYGGDAVEDVLRIVRDGNGADRQRRAFANGGMPRVLAGLVDETAAG